MKQVDKMKQHFSQLVHRVWQSVKTEIDKNRGKKIRCNVRSA